MFFIQCTLEFCKKVDVQNTQGTHNTPVNMDLCKYFSKSQNQWGEVTAPVYTIVFNFHDGRTYSWNFPTKKERDQEFERLKDILRHDK